ncbi:MAG: MFS transporter [Candidatus Cyclobacteriaceae bacterium M3_2C_046]
MKDFGIYGLQFWLLCLSSFLFFASFNMIIPELPNYLTSLGGEEYKGLIIALFTLTAGLSRPFSGKLTDKIGRIPVMVVGAVVSALSCLLYPLLTSVAGFLLLRFFHGFSTGFKPTGTSAYIADIVPDKRRGEAMGLLGFFGSTGMAFGPTMGGYIATYSQDLMFYTASGLAFLSIMILFRMKETLVEHQPFKPAHLKISLHEVIEPRVLKPSLVMVFSVFSFGIVLTLTPDLSEHLHLSNKGLFFTYFTLASLIIRVIAGKLSDTLGRIPVLLAATFTLTIALFSFGFIETQLNLVFSAVLFGMGVGMTIPALFAWTIDLSHPQHRGRAMATVYISLEIGIGAGALISAWLYNNNPNNFPISFWSGAIASAIAFIYVVYLVIRSKKVADKVI